MLTPIKNEAANLPQLKAAVLKQTMLPVVWVVTDSGSSDGSFNIAEHLFRGHEWIHVIHQRVFHGQGYADENMSAAINEGYECAKKLCADRHVDYSYVGKTDATPILQPDYFETLHKEMEKDPQLAFTCGIERLKYRGKTKEVKPFRNLSNDGYNDIRLYRKEFLDQIGGYSLTPSPDAVSMVKAANRGWEYAIVEQTYFVKPRLQGAKIGVWAGNKAKGTKLYRLGYHPILLLLLAMVNSIKFPPHYQAVPMTLGYVSSAVRRITRVDDKEVREYYGRDRLYELFYRLFGSF